MAPKPKPSPHRLGPPPQLNSLKIPVVQQKFAKQVQPKLREVVSRHIKILAKWFHTQFSWKKFLLFWMVMLIASKMVLLMLTFEFFSLTSLVSLEVGISKMNCFQENTDENSLNSWIFVMLSVAPVRAVSVVPNHEYDALWRTELISNLRSQTKKVTEVLLWFIQRVRGDKFFFEKKSEISPTCYVTAARFRLKNLKIRFYYPRGGLTWVHPWHWVVKRWRDNVRAENCRTEIFGNMRHYWHLSNNPRIRGNVSEASLTAWRPLCLNLPMTGHWSLMSS